MIFGKVEVEDKLYSFSFDEVRCRLTMHDLPGLVFTEDGKQAEEIFTFMSCIDGRTSNSNYPYIRFVVKGYPTRSINQVAVDVLYYIQTYKAEYEFEAMSFSSEELNWFYNVRNAYTFDWDIRGNINVNVKDYDSVDRKYEIKHDENLVELLLEYNRNIRNMDTNPLEIKTQLTLKFTRPLKYDEVYKYYWEILLLMKYISYRRNVGFTSIVLKEKEDTGKYSKAGEIIIPKDVENIYNEENKLIRERLVKSQYLGGKIADLLKLIHEERLYTKHIPENSNDMRSITTARFILTLAAFEWEVQEVYGDFKYETNEPFKEVTDKVYEVLEKLVGDYGGKKKKYLENYMRSFKYNGVNLAEKLNHAYKENDDVLKSFVGILYRMNKIDEGDYKYSKIAERLQYQRNAFAHGQIDREITSLAGLDLMTLEWLLYSMRLKQMGVDTLTCKKIINELFARRVHIE